MQWIGTWNNYTDADIEVFRHWCERHTAYTVCGKELGDSGTPHLQSFHQMKSREDFKAFKKIFPKVHIERVIENNGADKYCAKEGNLAFELGSIKKKRPGTRNDVHDSFKRIRTGCTLREFADEHGEILMKYPSGVARLLSVYEPPRDPGVPKDIVVLWGPSGSGKTRKAFEMAGVNPYVWDPGMGSWFDGYCGQKSVIMDEFRGQLPLGSLLRLFDRYPMRVQVKGGSVQFVADLIIVTSPKQPEKWYKEVFDNEDTVQQLLRRIVKVEYFPTVTVD